MSRTEGIYLPRLPPSHMRVATQPVTSQNYSWLREQTRELVTDPLGSVIPPEPAHKAFLCSPRYDLPPHVYTDPVMYEEVFVKEIPPMRKIPDRSAERPLTYNSYDSLHDPHCRPFFLNSGVFRRHLERQGFVTSDMRVVATPSEQRQRVRAHELLERREMLVEKLRERNEGRKLRLRESTPKLPKNLKWTLDRTESREKQKKFNLLKLKTQTRIREIESKKKMEDLARKEAKRIGTLLENLELQREKHKIENERQFVKQLKQDYERRYADKKRGKEIASWRMESDRIHNRIIHKTLLEWSHGTADPFQPDTFVTSNIPVRIEDLTPLSETREDQISFTESVAREEREREDMIEQILSDISRESFTPIDETPHYLTTTPELSYTPDEIEIPNQQQQTIGTGILQVEPRPSDDTTSDMDRPSDTDAFSGEEERSQVDLTYLSPVDKFYFIINESLRSIDPENTGSLVLENILQVLKQPNLGLFLTEEELHFIGSQYGTNRFQTVNYSSILSSLPQILSSIYHQRSQSQLTNYGYSFEEAWAQLYHPNTGYIYFNKFSKQLSDERPEDFRPALKDDLFEESIIEMIFLTDTRKDGVIDHEEFNNFLALQSTPLSSNQNTELKELFTSMASVTQDGVFYLLYSDFVGVVHQLITFLYQNMFPGQSVWIELPSAKVKSFWFNKQTGQTSLTRPRSEESVRTPERRTALGSRPQPLPAIEEVPSRPTSTVPTPLVPETLPSSATPTPPSLKRRDTPRRSRRAEKEIIQTEESKIDPHSDQEIVAKLAGKLSSLSTQSQPIIEEVDQPFDARTVSLATQIV